MFPAALQSIAFIISLFVQSMASPLASAWLFFHLAGCAILLAKGYDNKRSVVCRCCLAWLIIIGASTFLINPIAGSSGFMWILAAMPSLALCIDKWSVNWYVGAFGAIIFVFAAGLFYQYFMHVHYSYYNYDGVDGRSWPLLDPNTAAAIINMALIPCFWLALKDRRWLAGVLIFGFAIYITRSKAGAMAAVAGLSFIYSYQYRLKFIIPALYAGLALVFAAHFLYPEVMVRLLLSLADRIVIWHGCLPLLAQAPLTGLGMGTFGRYYAFTRVEIETTGFWAHNDPLQFAIEMGWPAGMLFLTLMGAIFCTVSEKSLPATAAIFAIFLQSLLEFQFYNPCVSIAMGAAISYHMLTCKGINSIMRPRRCLKHDPAKFYTS